jgi:hypothetical protein
MRMGIGVVGLGLCEVKAIEPSQRVDSATWPG